MRTYAVLLDDEADDDDDDLEISLNTLHWNTGKDGRKKTHVEVDDVTDVGADADVVVGTATVVLYDIG